MTKVEIIRLVNEGMMLDGEIKSRENRLKTIKGLLAMHLDGKPGVLSGDSCQAKIGFSARTVSRISDDILDRVKELAGKHFKTLFGYAPIEKCTDVAKALLEPDDFSRLTDLLKGAPSARVSFEKA